MSFWKDLMDATPGKSLARAQELYECGITGCIEIPSVMFDKVFDCSVCKVRFGQIFAKSNKPFLINSETKPSFAQNDAGVVVCDKCVLQFGYYDVLPRETSTKMGENQKTEFLNETEVAQPQRTNDEQKFNQPDRIVVCRNCRVKNRISGEKLNKKGIFKPICSVCKSELIIDL